MRFDTDGGTPCNRKKLCSVLVIPFFHKKVSYSPFDAIHRYDPISLRESFDNFKTSPLKDETIIRRRKEKQN